jgi:hypothetical protein
VPFAVRKIDRERERERTWVGTREDGGAAEVAAGLHGVALVVAVEGERRVVFDGAGAVAAPALLDGRAVRAALPAREVQRHLQRRRARAGARHAPAAPAAGAGRRVHHRDGGHRLVHVPLRRVPGPHRLSHAAVLCRSPLADSSPCSMNEPDDVKLSGGSKARVYEY